MTHGFKKRREGIEATFAAEEAGVVRGLTAELIELLRNDAPEPVSEPEDSFAALVGGMGSTEPPEDEVLKRLLPTAYTDDEESAADFRRFTELGIRDGKVSNAEIVLETLGDTSFADRVTVTLDPDQAQAWLRVLTDLRLALGTRLGVSEDDDEDTWATLPEEDRRRHIYGVYAWLGFVQESLVYCLT